MPVTRLDSGLTVVTESMPGVRSVAVGCFVGTGSRDEPAELAGASHFLEHLLFKGTPTRSARAIAEAIDGFGGDMNAFTTKEYTAFYVRVLAERLPTALEILGDIVSSPAFRDDDVEAERQVILEELLLHRDEPADYVHDLFLDVLYPAHPLGREVMGDEDTVGGLTDDTLSRFFRQHFGAANLVVAAAGAIEHEALVAAAAEAFRPPSSGNGPARSAPVQAPRSLAVEHQPTEQAHLVLGTIGLDRHDPDRYAFSVLNQLLGGGVSSRLFQHVREDRGLAYSVYSYRMAFADSGALALYAGTSPANAAVVAELLHGELDALVEGGVGDGEVELAKANIIGSSALNLEDSAARMNRVGRSQLVHGEVLTEDQLDARMAAVTVDDVARVISRVVDSVPRTLAAVGPFDETAFA